MKYLRFGGILGIVGAILALILGAFGLGMLLGGAPPPEAGSDATDSRFIFLVIPAMALAGSGVSSFNPAVASGLLGLAAAATLVFFGLGIFPLIIAGVLGLAALLIYVEV
jgi:hypothetical protein